MRKKTKIIASCISLSLSIFVMLVGVYSMLSREIGVSGTITYTATKVRASVEVKKTTPYTTGESNPIFSGFADNSGEITQETQEFSHDIGFGNIQLNDEANKFAYKVLITSKEMVNPFYVLIVPPAAPSQNWLTLTIERKNDGRIETENIIAIQPGKILEITYTYEINRLVAPTNAGEVDISSNYNLQLRQSDLP